MIMMMMMIIINNENENIKDTEMRDYPIDKACVFAF